MDDGKFDEHGRMRHYADGWCHADGCLAPSSFGQHMHDLAAFTGASNDLEQPHCVGRELDPIR